MNIYYTASLYENLQITAQVINGNGVNLNEMDGEKKCERDGLITPRFSDRLDDENVSA